MDRHESCEQLAYRLNKLAEIMDSVEGSHYASWLATLMAQGLDPQRLPSASVHQSEPTLPQLLKVSWQQLRRVRFFPLASGSHGLPDDFL